MKKLIKVLFLFIKYPDKQACKPRECVWKGKLTLNHCKNLPSMMVHKRTGGDNNQCRV